MSRNFLCPKSQVELWGGGEGVWHTRWHPSHHHLKDWQENVISPKIQAIFKVQQNSRIFYVQQVKLSFGMVVGGYGIPDDTPPTTTSKIDKKIL